MQEICLISSNRLRFALIFIVFCAVTVEIDPTEREPLIGLFHSNNDEISILHPTKEFCMGFSWINIPSPSYIYCHCDTAECRALGSTECRAEFYCFTVLQFTPLASAYTTVPLDGVKSLPTTLTMSAISRGCILPGLMDLCKGRRINSWKRNGELVTRCCRDAWCNSEPVGPTQTIGSRDQVPTILDSHEGPSRDIMTISRDTRKLHRAIQNADNPDPTPYPPQRVHIPIVPVDEGGNDISMKRADSRTEAAEFTRSPISDGEGAHTATVKTVSNLFFESATFGFLLVAGIVLIFVSLVLAALCSRIGRRRRVTGKFQNPDYNLSGTVDSSPKSSQFGGKHPTQEPCPTRSHLGSSEIKKDNRCQTGCQPYRRSNTTSDPMAVDFNQCSGLDKLLKQVTEMSTAQKTSMWIEKQQLHPPDGPQIFTEYIAVPEDERKSHPFQTTPVSTQLSLNRTESSQGQRASGGERTPSFTKICFAFDGDIRNLRETEGSSKATTQTSQDQLATRRKMTMTEDRTTAGCVQPTTTFWAPQRWDAAGCVDGLTCGPQKHNNQQTDNLIGLTNFRRAPDSESTSVVPYAATDLFVLRRTERS